MYKHINRNKNAGNDFLSGSLILKCIATEPDSKIAKPIAAGWRSTGYQMAAISPNAKMTLRVPTR